MYGISRMSLADGKRYRIVIDNGTSFMLYKGECAKYNLSEGCTVTQEVYGEIYALLSKRAVLRAEYLLKDRDYTEGQLKNKLIMSGYPEDIAVCTVELMKEYGFVNDYAYACGFIEDKSQRMSRRAIEYKLLEKYVPKEIVKEAFEKNEKENGEDFERQAFFNLYKKRNVDYGQLEQKDRRKLINYFISKGFIYENIVSYLREMNKFNENGT